MYSVFNECSEDLIVKSNFMFFFLYCVVFLLGSGCFLSLSFCQNVRFRPLCLPYSSVVPALMDFIRFSRCRVFTVLPGWGGFCFPFAVCGVRVCAGGPPACQVTGLFWVPYGYSRCVPFFFQINPGCGSEGVFPWPGCLSFSVFSRAVFRFRPVVSILCAERKTVRFRLIYRLAETECMIYGIYAGFGCAFA